MGVRAMSQNQPRSPRDQSSAPTLGGWLVPIDERRALAQSRRSTSSGTVVITEFDRTYTVPFIPTSVETAERMLDVAKVGPGDVVCDLGCGDARILILATESFKADKAVGYEIRRQVYESGLKEVEARNLERKVTVINGDLFDADLSDATVITLYLNYGVNKSLKPKLEKETKPGTRIVSHDFKIPDWKPVRRLKHQGDIIYLYVAPQSFGN